MIFSKLPDLYGTNAVKSNACGNTFNNPFLFFFIMSQFLGSYQKCIICMFFSRRIIPVTIALYHKKA